MTRPTAPVRDPAIRRVLDGETAASVARDCGINISTLQYRVRRAVEQGATRTRGRSQLLAPEALLKLNHLLDEGKYSWGTVARWVGCSWHTVKAHAAKRTAGTPWRRCGLHRTQADPCHLCGAPWARTA